MELVEVLGVLGLAYFSLFLIGYSGIRYIKNSHLFEDTITNGIINVINDAQSNEELQKNLFTVGALIGNGIAQGSGLKNSVKGGSKLSLNNVIAEIATSYFQRSINNPLKEGEKPLLTKKNPDPNAW